MCCWTHGDLQAYPGELAASDDWRCRCGCAPACRRKATGEDLLCDHCRSPSEPAAGLAVSREGLAELAQEAYGAPGLGSLRFGEYRRLLREAAAPQDTFHLYPGGEERLPGEPSW